MKKNNTSVDFLDVNKTAELNREAKAFLTGYLNEKKCVDYLKCNPFDAGGYVCFNFIYDKKHEVKIRYSIEKSIIRKGFVCWFYFSEIN